MDLSLDKKWQEIAFEKLMNAFTEFTSTLEDNDCDPEHTKEQNNLCATFLYMTRAYMYEYSDKEIDDLELVEKLDQLAVEYSNEDIPSASESGTESEFEEENHSVPVFDSPESTQSSSSSSTHWTSTVIAHARDSIKSLRSKFFKIEESAIEEKSKTRSQFVTVQFETIQGEADFTKKVEEVRDNFLAIIDQWRPMKPWVKKNKLSIIEKICSTTNIKHFTESNVKSTDLEVSIWPSIIKELDLNVSKSKEKDLINYFSGVFRKKLGFLYDLLVVLMSLHEDYCDKCMNGGDDSHLTEEEEEEAGQDLSVIILSSARDPTTTKSEMQMDSKKKWPNSAYLEVQTVLQNFIRQLENNGGTEQHVTLQSGINRVLLCMTKAYLHHFLYKETNDVDSSERLDHLIEDDDYADIGEMAAAMVSTVSNEANPWATDIITKAGNALKTIYSTIYRVMEESVNDENSLTRSQFVNATLGTIDRGGAEFARQAEEIRDNFLAIIDQWRPIKPWVKKNKLSIIEKITSTTYIIHFTEENVKATDPKLSVWPSIIKELNASKNKEKELINYFSSIFRQKRGYLYDLSVVLVKLHEECCPTCSEK